MQEPLNLCYGQIGSNLVPPDQLGSPSRHAMLHRSVSAAVCGGEVAHGAVHCTPDSWMRTTSQLAMKVSDAESGSAQVALDLPHPGEHRPVNARLPTGAVAARISRRSLEWPPTRPSLAAPASTYGSFGPLQRSAIAASYAQSAAQQQQQQRQQTEHRDAQVCLNLDAPEPLSLIPANRARQDLQLQLLQRQAALRDSTFLQDANPISSPFCRAPAQDPSSSRRLGAVSEGGAFLSHPQSPPLRAGVGGVGSRWGDCTSETLPALSSPTGTPMWPSPGQHPLPHPQEQQLYNQHQRLLSPPQLTPSGAAAHALARAHTSHGGSSSTPCTPARHFHSSTGPGHFNPTPPAGGSSFSNPFSAATAAAAAAAGSAHGNGNGAGPVSLSSFASRLPRLATRVAADSNGVASAPSTPICKAWAAAATDGRGSPAHHHTNRAAGSPMGVRSTPTKHHANHHHLHHLPAHHSATSAAHALALESALQRKRASLERSVMQGSPRGGLTHDASTARGGTFAQSFAAGRAAGYPRVASVQDLGQLRQTVARDGSISSGHKQNLLRMIDGAMRSGDRERPVDLLGEPQRQLYPQQSQQQQQQQQQQRQDEHQQQLLPLSLGMLGGTQSQHAPQHLLQAPAHDHRHDHSQYHHTLQQEQQQQQLQPQSPFGAPYASAAAAGATPVACSNGVGMPYGQGHNPARVLDLEASDSTFRPSPCVQAPTVPSATDSLPVAVLPSSGAATAAAASAGASPWGVFAPGRMGAAGGEPGGRMLQQQPLQRLDSTQWNAVPQMQQQHAPPLPLPPPQQQQQQRLYVSEGAPLPRGREIGFQEHHMADAWHGTAQPAEQHGWKEPMRQTPQGYPEQQQQQQWHQQQQQQQRHHHQQQQALQMRGDVPSASWTASNAPTNHTRSWQQQEQQSTPRGHSAQPAQGQVQAQPPPQHTDPCYPAAPPCPTPWLPSSHAAPQPHASSNPAITRQHPTPTPHQQPSHPHDRHYHHHHHHQPLYETPMPGPTRALPCAPQAAAPPHQLHQQPYQPQEGHQHQPAYDTPVHASASSLAPMPPSMFPSMPPSAPPPPVPPPVPTFVPTFTSTPAPAPLAPRSSDVAGRQLSASTPPAAACEHTGSTDCGPGSTPASADPACAPAAAAGSQVGTPLCFRTREFVASYLGTPGEQLAAPYGAVQLKGYAVDSDGDRADVGLGMGVGEDGGGAGEGAAGRQGQRDVQLEELLEDGARELDEVLQQLLDEGVDELMA